jgi:hypothetical protein
VGLFLLGAGAAGAAWERVFIADGHRYVPDEAAPVDAKKEEIGQALCGVRCNALSGYYDSYIESPGWRLILVEKGKQVRAELNNPFLSGYCICTGDEYEAEVYYYRPGHAPPPGVEAQGTEKSRREDEARRRARSLGAPEE